MRPTRTCLGPLLLVACGGGQPGPGQEEPYQLAPVIKNRLARLEGEVGPQPALQGPDPQAIEELEGLLEMASGADPKFAALAHDAIAADFGAAAIGTLVRALLDGERSWQARSAAASLLATLDHPRAADQLMETLEASPEPWLRRHVAFHLTSTSLDRVVPRLIKRLKYEQDPETFVWLAVGLAHFNNYSGLNALFDLAERGSTPELRALAKERLDGLANEQGTDPAELHRRWNSIEAGSLPAAHPSPALRLEAWRLAAAMSDDTIQLRGVDDARYVLCRLGPWAAVELSDALADEDFHVRLHTAQVLERMGPRAQGAGPALLKALAEPLLAPSAAEALGRVGFPAACQALREAAAPGGPHELRVASVRALGRLGLPDGLPPVLQAFADPSQPQDIRMAAATALVLLAEGDRAAAWLRGRLAGEDGDGPAAELALETWLVRGEMEGRAGFAEALESWSSEWSVPPGVTPSLEQLAERRARRAQGLDVQAIIDA